jgi:hypothetical protein
MCDCVRCGVRPHGLSLAHGNGDAGGFEPRQTGAKEPDFATRFDGTRRLMHGDARLFALN